jgi:hypothetical protein
MEALPNPYEDETTESYEPWTEPTQEEIDAEFYTIEEMRAEAEKLLILGGVCTFVAENFIEALEDNEKLIKLNEYLLTQQENNLKLCDRYRDALHTSYRAYETLSKDAGVIILFLILAWVASVLISIYK